MKKHIYLVLIAVLTSFSSFSQEGKITIEQDAKIAQLISLKSEMTEKNAFGERYKIQIFYGNNGKANEVLQEFEQAYPEWPSILTYQAPNYKIWVGDFRNRLEADRAFLMIKDTYTSAFILPQGK